MKISEYDLINAFKKGHSGYLRKIHLELNKHYHNLMFNENEQQSLSVDEWIELKKVECVWIEHEKSECLNRYDCQRPINTSHDIEMALQEHPAFNHAIFHYLHRQATLDDIKNYILSDSILNMEFFDYLALAIIGVNDVARAEIITNLWEEAGRGNIDEFHTGQFRKLMHSLGLRYKREPILEIMCWEGLAGINLFSYFSLYSFNKMKLFGLMAATEMLDPPHYHLLIKALSRVQKSQSFDKKYYIEHESIDVIHASGWVNNVILPGLAASPEKISEFWLGFYMRLDSVQRYYDKLLDNFINRIAA